MIRPFTVLCLLTACGSGLYLYSEKHRTTMLDREIGRVIHAAEVARARTGLLRAEWAVANEPGRLQDMAGRYLSLHPMAPTQFVQVADLSTHLPAPIATPAEGSADEDEAAPSPDVAPAAAPDTVIASVGPDAGEAPAQAPATSRRALPAGHADKLAAKVLASATPRPHAHHPVALADGSEQSARLMTRGTPLPLAAPQPVGAAVYSAMARPMRATAPHPAIVSAVPSYAPAQSYVPSALGGGTALPPPVPYGR